MAAVCPTITAMNTKDYVRQVDNVKKFAHRIHIDLMDGEFSPTTSVDITKIWLPKGLLSDIHVMYKHPMDIADHLVNLNPHMVIIHKESDVDLREMSSLLHRNHIRVGLALLQDTPLDSVRDIISIFDQILIFGGHLGYQGGHANLNLLDKVRSAGKLYPRPEIAWDGGINEYNAIQLVEAGVNVLNVGSFIQFSPDPKEAYDKLLSSLR